MRVALTGSVVGMPEILQYLDPNKSLRENILNMLGIYAPRQRMWQRKKEEPVFLSDQRIQARQAAKTQAQFHQSRPSYQTAMKSDNYGKWPQIVDSLALLDPLKPRSVVTD
jgi:hypothetical protein